MRPLVLLLLTSVALAGPSPAPSQSGDHSGVNSDSASRVKPLIGTHGMVVSDDRQASEWGAEVLRRGGNAIDAAVATAFMLSVTRPYYASLGGGGFLVYCPAGKSCETLDYREVAPKDATRDMFVRGGKAHTELSQNGALASGIPGVTAGLLTALGRWGHKTREELLREPIRIAETGFRTTGVAEAGALERWEHMNPEARKIMGCPSGAPGAGTSAAKELRPCAPSTLLRQPELARVLREISSRGERGFYRGWVGRKLVEGIRTAGGIFTQEDLESYHAVLQKPLVGHYAGHEIVTMALPSGGGTGLLQMLGYAERAKAQGSLDAGFGSVGEIHAMAHAMALAYADRAKYLGDGLAGASEKLLSSAYLDSRWKSFNPSHAAIPEGPGALLPEGTQTTSFSVIDEKGNAVAITTTVNDYFGSAFVPPGTGIFMNNEMDDFSIQPGVPNLFGLVGSEANAIAPGKRPLSSMTPTIVRDGDGVAQVVIGGAGGSRIPTAVFNVLVDQFTFGMSLPDAMAAPRIHEQWRPAELTLERYGFSPENLAKLKTMGYAIQESVTNAKLHAILRLRDGRVWGAPDPRGEGAAAVQ